MKKPKKKVKKITRSYVNRKPYSVSLTEDERKYVVYLTGANGCDNMSDLFRKLAFTPAFRKAYKQPKMVTE